MRYLKTYEALLPKKQKTVMKVGQIGDDIKTILKDCEIFINDLKKCDKGYFLSRGIYNKTYDIEKLSYDMDREPRDTEIALHDQLNNWFEEYFGWMVRNGLFCFGRPKHNLDTDYGSKSYLLFPIGDYDIVWSKYIDDLYSYLDGEDLFNKTDIEDAYLEEYGEGTNGEYLFKNQNTYSNDKTDAIKIVLVNYEEYGYNWDEEEYPDKEDFKDELWHEVNDELEWEPELEYDEFYTRYCDENAPDFSDLMGEFQYGNLCGALKNYGEISVRTNDFYYIDTKYADELTEIIWGK